MVGGECFAIGGGVPGVVATILPLPSLSPPMTPPALYGAAARRHSNQPAARPDSMTCTNARKYSQPCFQAQAQPRRPRSPQVVRPSACRLQHFTAALPEHTAGRPPSRRHTPCTPSTIHSLFMLPVRPLYPWLPPLLQPRSCRIVTLCRTPRQPRIACATHLCLVLCPQASQARAPGPRRKAGPARRRGPFPDH